MKHRLAILFPVFIFIFLFLLFILTNSSGSRQYGGFNPVGGGGLFMFLLLPAIILLGFDNTSPLFFILFDLVLIVPILSLIGYWIDRKIRGRSADESRIMTKKQFIILIIILAAMEILIYFFGHTNRTFIDYPATPPGVYY